jgi:hypothetical protein
MFNYELLINNYIDGNQDYGENFRKCFRSNVCIFLDDGKLYTCRVVPNIKHFNKYFGKKLVVSEKDYINKFNKTSASYNLLTHLLTGQMLFA